MDILVSISLSIDIWTVMTVILGWHIDTPMQFYGGGWSLGLTSMLY